MPRPTLALQEDLLVDGKEADPSGHKVNHIIFQDADKQTKHGFKKLCNNDDYPSLLAKYVVAFSVFIRMGLGEKAAEDRLVYSNEEKIIGTASIDVPNFEELLPKKLPKGKKAPNKSSQKYKLAVPDVAMLLKKKMARLLLSAYKHKQNDLHTGNISVNGLIDWDECYYDLTSIIKGRRVLSSSVLPVLPSPEDIAQYKEEDIRSLPRVEGRVHWVGNSTDWLQSRAPLTTAFIDLEKDKETKNKFAEQKHRAILTELLCFDKKVLAERLKLCLGDEKLNLEELPPAKRTELLEFGKNRNLFFDKDGKERSFVDHCLTFFEQEHEKFKKVVLNMPEFRDYLIEVNNNPKKLMKIKKQFIKQNIKSIIPHDLNTIGIEFHSIWRTCNQEKLDEKLKSLKNIIQLHRSSPLCKTIMNEDVETSYSELNEKLSPFIKPEEKSKLSPLIVRHDTKPAEIKQLSGILHLKIRKQVINLHEHLSNLINAYYAKSNATIKDNHKLIEDIKNIIVKNEEERIKLNEWFQEKKEDLQNNNLDIYILLMQLIRDMDVTFKKLDNFNNELQEVLMKFKLNQTIEDESSTVKIHSFLIPDAKPASLTIPSPRGKDAKIPTDIDDYSDSEVDDKDADAFITEKMNIDQLSTLLKIWNKQDKADLIKRIIRETHTQEYFSIFYMFSRKRGAEVYDYSLNKLFSEGGWESTSLNTLVMRNVCLAMLTENKACPFRKSIYDRIAHNDIEWWSKISPEIAKQYSLKTSASVQAKVMDVKLH